MKTTRRRIVVLAAASAAIAHAHDDENPPAISRTALIHGTAGPYAVAGYLMGEHALSQLGAERGSMELEVIHYSPAKVQWSCIVDGLQASTGASLGKMNLRRVDSAKTYSLVRNRKTGQSLRIELLPAFLQKFANLPYEKLPEAGVQVSEMKPAEVFAAR
jgi:formylmethanofuran dehydrogenase subunit E